MSILSSELLCENLQMLACLYKMMMTKVNRGYLLIIRVIMTMLAF